MVERYFVHDMKNLLGIVIGYANLLLDEMPAGDSRRADVEEIKKAGDGALALLEEWDTSRPGEAIK
jgi:signal transduction histidine kinase